MPGAASRWATRPGVLTEATADLAFALLLAVARRLPESAALVTQDRWLTWDPLLLLGRDVSGATLGIVGFGRIGQEVARRAKGFGMRILAHSRRRGTRGGRTGTWEPSPWTSTRCSRRATS